MNHPHTLFLIAASAAVGKVMGGWMISRFPRIHDLCAVMLASLLLLSFARSHIAGLCAGIALLQSTIPGSIILLRRSFGATPATAAAYGLGVTVALGGIVAPASGKLAGLGMALAAVAGLLFWRSVRGERRCHIVEAASPPLLGG